MRRSAAYDPLKVDIWSLGATVWEMAQAVPPFADIQDPRQMGTRLPPLSQPEIWSRSFHDFLRLCSEPASTRPCPGDLLDVRSLPSLYTFFRANSPFPFRPHSSGTRAVDRSSSNSSHNVGRSRTGWFKRNRTTPEENGQSLSIFIPWVSYFRVFSHPRCIKLLYHSPSTFPATFSTAFFN